MSKKIITLKDIEAGNNTSEFLFSDSYEDGSQLNKLNKPINFENKRLLVLNYELKFKGIISDLVQEVEELRQRIRHLEEAKNIGENVLIAQNTLKDIWDNEKDDIWNDI